MDKIYMHYAALDGYIVKTSYITYFGKLEHLDLMAMLVFSKMFVDCIWVEN
jgi:hypothetical protein